MASGAAAGEHAVFYSGGDTYLVDVDARTLWFAPGWLSSHDGKLNLYRLRAQAGRKKHRRGTPKNVASRWTVLETAQPGDGAWRALTHVPPIPSSGYFQDERAALQFRGDAVSLARFRRSWNRTSATSTVHTRTLSLPAGTALPKPRGADEALSWFSSRLPELVPTAGRSVGVVDRELIGGAMASWLISATPDGAITGLAIGPPQRPAGWKAAPEGALDLRRAPNADVALLLEGARPVKEQPILDDLQFGSPCVSRELVLLKGSERFPLGRVARLDGTRWLAADDPLVLAKRTRFSLRGAVATSPARRGRAGIPTAKAAQIDEFERPWGGPRDLAAAVGVSLEESAQMVHLEVLVADPDRTAKDRVRIWLAQRGTRLDVSPDGKIHARRRDRSRARRISAEWIEGGSGYRVLLDIPQSLLGSELALTVRIDDSDGAGVLHLWAAGHPIDRRRTAATPMESAKVSR